MAYYGKQVFLIENQLQIFTIKDSKRGGWYAIIKLPKTARIRRSLGTTLRRDAERKAFNLYNKYRALHEEGLPVLDTSWDTLVNQYDSAKDYGKTTGHRIKMLRIFFGKVDNVRDIDAKMIQRWTTWRKQYWLSKEGKKHLKRTGAVGGRHVHANVGTTTLKMEASVLKGILRYGFERGIIGFIPDIAPLMKRRTYTGDGTHRRAAFTNSHHASIMKYINDDYKRLTKQSQTKTTGYYHALAKGNEYMLFPRQRNRRMHLWCLLLATSGIRPTEARNLLFRDVASYDDRVNDALLTQISIRAEVAKTGEPRTIYVVDSGSTYEGVSLLWKTIEAWRSIARFNEPDDLIFSNTNVMGKRNEPAQMPLYFSRMIKSFGKAGTRGENYKPFVDAEGKEFSSYSYRHRFITEALKKGVSPYFVSVHAGTSYTQIRKHYAHLFGLDVKDEFFAKNEEARIRRAEVMRRSVVELSKVG